MSDDQLQYDVLVVGGGPAGMTTALYTTRLGHRTAVIEKKGGRHGSVAHVHNLFGISEDVSGRELAEHATEQLEEYGGHYIPDQVHRAYRSEQGDDFIVEGPHTVARAEVLVIATGFQDREPPVPSLRRFTGRGLHYCLHCDAYSLGDGRVYIMGHDDSAASVAMMMLNYTAEVELLLNGQEPEWNEETEAKLRNHPIDRIDTEIVDAFPDDDTEEPWLGGLHFGDGTDREYLGGFAMYGKAYNTEVAEPLGCELATDGAIEVDDSHETTVENVFAVGDVTHGQNQTAIAHGDGARAGIAIHQRLRRFPMSAHADELATASVPAAPGDLRARMRLSRERDTQAGLREPRSNR